MWSATAGLEQTTSASDWADVKSFAIRLPGPAA